jgi:hypothetical protein
MHGAQAMVSSNLLLEAFDQFAIGGDQSNGSKILEGGRKMKYGFNQAIWQARCALGDGRFSVDHTP